MATTPVPPLAARNALPKRTSGAARLVRPLLSLLVLLTVAAASATTTWLWTTRGLNPHQSQPTGADALAENRPVTPPAPPAVPIFLPLDAFNVSLQNAEIERMLHMRITLRVEDDASRQRLERYMPEVRNRVLLLLSAQSPNAIITPNGKTELAQAVRNALSASFSPLAEKQGIRDVLFTEFVVQ